MYSSSISLRLSTSHCVRDTCLKKDNASINNFATTTKLKFANVDFSQANSCLQSSGFPSSRGSGGSSVPTCWSTQQLLPRPNHQQREPQPVLPTPNLLEPHRPLQRPRWAPIDQPRRPPDPTVHLPIRWQEQHTPQQHIQGRLLPPRRGPCSLRAPCRSRRTSPPGHLRSSHPNLGSPYPSRPSTITAVWYGSSHRVSLYVALHATKI